MKDVNVVSCMLSDALGSAIAYWAEARNIKNDGEGNVLSFEVRDDGNEGPRVCKDWKLIDADVLRAGAILLRDGKVKVRQDIAAVFAGAESSWDYDDESLDCAIQAAVFGEIVYG